MSAGISPTLSLDNIAVENAWVDLDVCVDELRCEHTLTTGQSFSWWPVSLDEVVPQSESIATESETTATESKKTGAWGSLTEKQWVGVVRDMVFTIKSSPTTTLARLLTNTDGLADVNVKAMLTQYFQLNVPLAPLYRSWAASAPTLFTEEISAKLKGVRVLKQDPWEVLLMFLTSR